MHKLRCTSADFYFHSGLETNVNYQEWLPLFGLPANDPKVVAALASNGVTSPVTLPPQEFSTGVDFKNEGISVGFTSEFTLRGGAADLPILSSVVMQLRLGAITKDWTPYSGPLPHGLKKSNTKDEIVALLGTPANLDQDFCSALWIIDRQELGILFTDDWRKIKQLGLSLPGAT